MRRAKQKNPGRLPVFKFYAISDHFQQYGIFFS
jgi:hypothetical protein